MREPVFLVHPRRERNFALPPRRIAGPNPDVDGFGRQDQLRLPRPDQIDIDFGQQFGVEQRAVLGATGIVDRVARAQIVEPVRDAGMLAARQQQRIDQPVTCDDRSR